MAASRPPVRGVVAALAGLGLVGLVLDVAGVTPWLLVGTALAVASIELGQRMSWGGALAGTIVGAAAVYAVLLRVLQPVPVGFEWKPRAVLVVAVIAGLLLILRRPALRLPPAAALVALAPFVLVFLVLGIVVQASGGLRAGWAMHNDAIWNLISARFIVADGGVASEHPNVAPLTSGLLALGFASGRAGLTGAEVLAHDVTGAAQAWLVILLASSLLAGAIAWRSLPAVSTRGRAVVTALIALLPLGWSAAGSALPFGFVNAGLAVALAFAAWLGWLEARSRPLGGAVILSGAAIALLATWAPMAALPLALGLATLIRAPRDWWRGLRGPRLVVLVLALAAIVVYAGAVTLVDVLRETGALSSDGGIFPIRALDAAAVTALAVAAVLVAWGLRSREALGVLVLAGTGVLVIAYLVYQRLGSADLFGYYPAKFGWVLNCTLIVLAASALARFGFAVRSRFRVLALAVGALLVLIATILPFPTRAAVPSLAAVVAPVGAAVPEPTLQILFELAAPGRTALVSGYSEDPAQDRFADGWLLQLASDGPSDPVRTLSYLLDPADPAHLCQAFDQLDRPVEVITRDPGLAAALQAQCPRAEVTVELR